MQLVSGTVVDIYEEDGLLQGKVSVSGAAVRVQLTFLPDVQIGDKILVSSGVAVAKVESQAQKETDDVSGNSR